MCSTGFLGSFLSKNLKTYQVEVNTDERTLKPIARLKEPRDLFALPKDKDHDCSQQAPRWPIECQVLDERIHHIEYVPELPESYYQPTGHELRPRPVGEENGIVVFNYNPVSSVNYKNEYLNTRKDDSDGSDSDSSTDSRSPTPELMQKPNNIKSKNRFKKRRFSKMFRHRSSSNSNDDEDFDDDDDYDDDDDDCNGRKKRTVEYEKCYIYQNPQPVPIPIDIQSPPPQYSYSIKSSSNDDDDDDEVDNDDDDYNNNYEEYDTNDDNDNNDNNCEITTKFKSISINENNNDSNSKINNDNNNLCFTQFSRSGVGGSKFLTNVHPNNFYNTIDDELSSDDLIFESRFESGNLAKAVKITSTYYELYLRPDLYTNRHKQWFYFRVKNTKKHTVYRFSIVNLVKSDSLYNEGMRPLMYSVINAKEKGIGWRRCGENICYYRNDDESSSDEDDDNGSYTLTFNILFSNDEDTVYFAHSYPYTYSDLQDYLMDIQKHPIKSKFCKLRLLCRSLAGNNVYYLTVTAPSPDEEANKKKRAIILTARVHPGETPSSWIMKGLMDFITGDSPAAKRLRHKFIFKLVPMLNPDGVIVGNTRSSLTGKDLNRQYRTVIRETYPSIWYTKAMIKRLIDDCGVAMYCDMHAHSRKHNIFIYGCENKRNPEKKLSEQVFPLMVHKNSADKFSFESCKFKIQRSKEGTGRIVIWMLGVTNSYTMEASFGGSTIGSRNGTHFSTADYEHMGRAFCETLLDYYDDNPIKERLRNKIIERLLAEGSSAEEPLNIPLSDYSSDEGDTTSSSSDNESGKSKYYDFEGPCCQPLKAPPCSPNLNFTDNKKSEEKLTKKVKVKCKSSTLHKREKSQRIQLDIPITDPGSDVQFSTEDEYYVDDDEYGKISKNYRSHETKKYDSNDEYDNNYEEQQSKYLPPELIVTPAKQNLSESLRVQLMSEEKIKKPLSPSSMEFPPITGARNSWHHLNTKGVSKTRNQMNAATIDVSKSLNYKLSFKNNIWVGVVPEEATSSNDYSRPLSWGIPPIVRKKIHHVTKDENEALLMACSQRLAALQAKEFSSSKIFVNETVTTTSFLSSKENRREVKTIKNNVTINLVIPAKSEKINGKSKKNSISKNSSKTDVIPTETKIKKKKNSLSKIAETTHIITRLAKTKAKNTLHNRKSDNKNTTTITTSSSSNKTKFCSSSFNPFSKSSSKGNNKFKTGGLAATAIQNPVTNKKKKSHRHYHLVPVIRKDNTTSIIIESDQDNCRAIVKKVKSKIKKKKK